MSPPSTHLTTNVLIHFPDRALILLQHYNDFFFFFLLLTPWVTISTGSTTHCDGLVQPDWRVVFIPINPIDLETTEWRVRTLTKHSAVSLLTGVHMQLPEGWKLDCGVLCVSDVSFVLEVNDRRTRPVLVLFLACPVVRCCRHIFSKSTEEVNSLNVLIQIKKIWMNLSKKRDVLSEKKLWCVVFCRFIHSYFDSDSRLRFSGFLQKVSCSSLLVSLFFSSLLSHPPSLSISIQAMVDVLISTGILYILGINHCRRDGRWLEAWKGKFSKPVIKH